MLTHDDAQALQNATVSLLQYVSQLLSLIDNVALLDMLCAFATVATSSAGQYVRPKMTESGPIAIVDGRHVLLENRADSSCQVLRPCFGLSQASQVASAVQTSACR